MWYARSGPPHTSAHTCPGKWQPRMTGMPLRAPSAVFDMAMWSRSPPFQAPPSHTHFHTCPGKWQPRVTGMPLVAVMAPRAVLMVWSHFQPPPTLPHLPGQMAASRDGDVPGGGDGT